MSIQPTPIVDVDAHFFEPFTWLEETDPHLAARLAAELPPMGFGEVVFGEVLAELPPEDQQQFAELLPVGRMLGSNAALSPDEMERRIQDSPLAGMLRAPGHAGGVERVAVNDDQGIDIQLLNPTIVLGLVQQVRRNAPNTLAELCEAYNSWAMDAVAGHTDRLVPVGLVDFTEPPRAAGELARLREGGSRAFLLPLYPIEGRSLAHPDFDIIWAAAEDLGMIPVLHVAAGSVSFDPGWANNGRPNRAATAFRLAVSMNAQIPQLPLGDLILSGTFDRHPKLTVLCAEFGISWIVGWLDKLGPADRRGTTNITGLLPWDLERPAHEYVRTNLRFSPLRGQNVAEVIDLLGPDLVVFASDYPHPEGSSSAVADFRRQLEGFEPEVVDRFFTGMAPLVMS